MPHFFLPREQVYRQVNTLCIQYSIPFSYFDTTEAPFDGNKPYEFKM